MQFFTAVLSALALAASTASASPIAARQNVTAVPRITSPTWNVTWDIGTLQGVSWDTSTIPANDTGANGVLFLGNDDQACNFTTIPLSHNFSLESGYAPFTVPNVTTSTYYYLVLSIGDSVDPSAMSQLENRTPDLTILSSWA